jgi:hypothetical protein
MKTTVLAALLAAGTATHALTTPVLDAAEPRLEIINNTRARSLTLSVGPLALPAEVKYGGSLVTVSEAAGLPIDGWLRSFEIELVDARGRRIREPLLHHAGLFSSAQRDLFSPAMRRIVAFGRETEAIRLPREYGYRVAPRDSILLLGALFNPTAVAYDSLYLRITMSYSDAVRDVPHANVLPLYLDVLPPGNREYDVPPGRSQRSWDWKPGISGHILALGGHLHRYGRMLVLEDVTAGDTIWVGKAKYDANGELRGISRKIFIRAVKVRTDHVYRLTATYDNPTGQVVRGAMGKIGGLFLPNPGERLAAVDRTDPDYIRDLNAMLHHTHEMDHVMSTEQRVAADRARSQ